MSVWAKHTGAGNISLNSKNLNAAFTLTTDLLIAYWLPPPLRPTFPQRPENGAGRLTRWHEQWHVRSTCPLAGLEQIELETPSAGGSAASWAPRCDTGLDLPQRKSSPKVCINTVFTAPCPVRSAFSTRLLPGLQLAQAAAGNSKCGPGHDSSKVGVWLIELEYAALPVTDTKCGCHVEGKNPPSCPRWLILCWGIEWELPRSSIPKSYQLHNIYTWLVYWRGVSPVIDIWSQNGFTLSRIQFKLQSTETVLPVCPIVVRTPN